MGEDSRRGAPRPARSPGGAGSRPDARGPRSGGRGAGSGGSSHGGSASRGYGGHRPGGQGKSSSAGYSSQGGARSGGQGSGRQGSGGQAAASTTRLTSVIEPVLRAMEIDLEAVKLSSAGRRAVLRIVVDADGGISLDDIAEVSREVAAKLDAKNVMGDAPYTLEVTSPGVDRPLTQPRHWRRAEGRLVTVRQLDQDDQGERDASPARAEYLGRVIGADHDSVTLEIDGARRTFQYGELGPGRVQVEFGRLDEIDDADDEDLDARLDDADDSWQGEDIADSGGPDEEEPDGH
jgi:ribosome maturation factor RimP